MTGFIYFTQNGDPLAMQDLGDAGLTFGEHPLDPNIQVLFVGNSGGGTSFHISTEDVAENLPIGTFLQGLGLDPATVNDMLGRSVGGRTEH